MKTHCQRALRSNVDSILHSFPHRVSGVEPALPVHGVGEPFPKDSRGETDPVNHCDYGLVM